MVAFTERRIPVAVGLEHMVVCRRRKRPALFRAWRFDVQERLEVGLLIALRIAQDCAKRVVRLELEARARNQGA